MCDLVAHCDAAGGDVIEAEIPAPKFAGIGTSGTTDVVIAARLSALEGDASDAAEREREELRRFAAALPAMR